MKFTFESDMKKGDCFSCPLNHYDYANKGIAVCGLTNVLGEAGKECPLEEAKEIEWHPYPEEKPPHAGRFLVTYKNKQCHNRRETKTVSYLFKSSMFNSHKDSIIAWAELPEPYKEEK